MIPDETLGEGGEEWAEISPGKIRRSGRVLVIDGVRPDLLDPLRRDVLDQMRQQPWSQPTLNQGGWKSDNLRTWRSPAADELREEILRRVAGQEPQPQRATWVVEAWAMVNDAGDQHPRHVHQGATASGIYVVDPGIGEATPTLFEVGSGEVAIQPVPARLVLFPADLWHRVPPCTGGPRITIAFDVK